MPASTMKWPVLVKSPGPTLQMTGGAGQESAANALLVCGHFFGDEAKLGRAFGHERPGGAVGGRASEALGERAHVGRCHVGAAGQRHVRHGHARRPATGGSEVVFCVGSVSPCGIALVQRGHLAGLPSAFRRRLRACGGRSAGLRAVDEARQGAHRVPTGASEGDQQRQNDGELRQRSRRDAPHVGCGVRAAFGSASAAYGPSAINGAVRAKPCIEGIGVRHGEPPRKRWIRG